MSRIPRLCFGRMFAPWCVRSKVKPSPSASGSVGSGVERLEDRRLLAAAFLTGEGVLVIQGNPSTANALSVNLWNNGTQILAGGKDASVKVARSAVKQIRVIGGNLNDSIWVSPDLKQPAEISGLGGNDSIRGGGGNDTIDGGAGNDSIRGFGGNDVIYGGDGNDWVSGGEGNDILYGNAGDDRISGDNGDDWIDGGAGNDTLSGLAGKDTIYGGDGDDVLEGWGDNDSLLGGGGADSLIGGSGNDHLDGGSGANLLDGGYGTDTLLNTDGTAAPGSPSVPVDPTLSAGQWVTLRGAASGASPQIVLKILGQRITAGGAVHVNATESLLSAGSPLTARYEWDFGDAGADYNRLVGWTAAHQYDRAGTYNISLRVTDESGRSSTHMTQVQVAADNRRTIHVSSAGNDANTGLSPDAPIRTFTRAAQLVNNDTRILFRRGDTFAVSSQMHITHRNVLVGAYGSGAKPVLNKVDGPHKLAISVWTNATDVVIRDLTFDSIYKVVNNWASPVPASAINPGGANVVVRNNTFLNINYAINAERKPAGLLVQGNDAPLADGLRAYLVWGQGTDHTYLGNRVVNSTREHAIRTSDLHRLLVVDNDLQNLNRQSVDGPDYSKASLNVQRGSWAYVASNKFAEGAVQLGPRGLDSEGPGVKTENVVFEGNRLHGNSVQLWPGLTKAVIRNNILTQADNDSNVLVKATDSLGRKVSDAWIVNNTGHNTFTDGRFLAVEGRASNLNVANNLFVMPNMATGGNRTASVTIYADDMASFSSIRNNVWQIPARSIRWAENGHNYVAKNWVSWGYRTPTEWAGLTAVQGDVFARNTIGSDFAPAAGSVATTTGRAFAGVFTDFYGKTRASTGTVTAGAVQR